MEKLDNPRHVKKAKARHATGPTSASGKARSSRNALTHGATAHHLVNEAEQKTYQAWIEQLSKTYASENPLVQLQIERIAQLKVQLDRIQTAISAIHEIERLKKISWRRAVEVLSIKDEEFAHFIWALNDKELQQKADIDEHYDELIKPALELTALTDLDLFTTHQEFLNRAPLFCQYLIDCAKREDLDIDAYARIKQIPPENRFNGGNAPAPSASILWQNRRPSGTPRKTQITDIPIEDLTKTAVWHLSQLSKFIERSERVHRISQVSQFVEQSVLPDLDSLDKLMRYQTTINRQLSTAIGELLAMTRSPAM